jgi:SNF2 family DNA or RNA helicase/DnaJ-domain-containing protein 1
MSFIKTIGQKLGSTISPLEPPETHVIPIPPVAGVTVHNIPLPTHKTAISFFDIPKPKVLTTGNLKRDLQPAKVFVLTNGLFSSTKVTPNLLFSASQIEAKAYSFNWKSTESINFNFDWKAAELTDYKFDWNSARLANFKFNWKPTELTNFKVGFEIFITDDLHISSDVPDVGTNLFQGFEETIISNDLTEELFQFQEETRISANLFNRLTAHKVNGKSYEKKANRQPDQPDFFNTAKAKSKSNDYVKAYKREKTKGASSSYSTQTTTFWDLLYPVLLPPLDVEFNSQFELFAPLFKFQPAGIEFLVRNESALLADEMGTGKTVMSSVALKLLFRLGRVKKALIVCPVSLLKTWQDHLLNWADELALTVVRGTPDVRKLDWTYNAHVYLTTYDTVASDFLTKIKRHNKFVCPSCGLKLNLGSKITLEADDMPDYSCPECGTHLNDYIIENLPKKSSIVDPEILNSFDVVLIDEAQYIKNKTSDRSRAIRLLKPKHKWALTGTPIENRLDDIVSIFSFVKPDLFRNEYLSPKRVAELIKPYFLRRLKKDVMKDLPPKVKQEIWLELDDDQMKAYKAAEQTGIKEIEDLGGKATKIHIFSLISKLKQICNFAPFKSKSAKTEELLDLVEEIKANNQKVLVFSQYDVEGVSKLETLLQPFGVSVLKGGMSDSARNSAIHKFKTDQNIAVFLATIKTGGVGLTLTEASYVIHFDHWWNPALMWQADDRVHRSGQKSSQVNIYSFWMQGTIEERIHFILKEKGLLFDEVINGLSVEDVEDMFTMDDWFEVLGIKSRKQTADNQQGQNTYKQWREKQNSQQQEDSRQQNRQQTNSSDNHGHTNGEHRQKQKEHQQKSNNNRKESSNSHSKNNHRSKGSEMDLDKAFVVLGIPPYSTKELIVKAYRDLMKTHHPDKVGNACEHASKMADEKSKEINAAYEVLKRYKYV